MIGKIIKILPIEKAYGFVQDENGSQYFFHKNNTQDFIQLKLNDQVEFELDETAEKIQAINVKKINGKAEVISLQKGKIVTINVSRGFAFLLVDFLQKNVFLHRNNFAGDFLELKIGDEIIFENVELTKKGYVALGASLAEKVVVLNDNA